MAKKQTGWKTKGMNRDLSVSAFNPEFAFENMNLRLSTNDGNTLLSWVNEKGTSVIELSKEIEGTPIGTAVLNQQLVLFTTSRTKDYIYVLNYTNQDKNFMQVKVLYDKKLGFDANHPLETLVSYESEKIQKVYWVDGINQPRVVNIASANISDRPTTYFDFVPTLQLNETVIVNKILSGNGTFAPGVIQYALTYYNKYGQESNIFYTSPLQYISYKERGASPEDKVENSFKIIVENVDSNFDYLRIYSIQRTSINGTPICKRIQDIEIKNLSENNNHELVASFVDTGTSGDSIDPTELLYKGGDIVTAETIEQKDSTLFLGNIVLTRPSVTSFKNQVSVNVEETATRSFKPISVSTGYYNYSNQLTSEGIADTRHAGRTVPCAGFKTGDVYRLGIQFQHKSGKWSEPIYIGDKTAKGKFSESIDQTTINVPVFNGSLTSGASQLISAGYKKMRPVVVFPRMMDRNIICQGVIAPTVYTQDSRNDNSCYAQSSWFFRPYVSNDDTEGQSTTVMAPKSSNALRYTSKEINGSNVFNPQYIRQVEIEGQFDVSAGRQFKIDRTYRTLHSPDIEFDDQISLIDFTGKSFKKRGMATFVRTMSDIDIQTETPTISSSGAGFVHKPFSSTGAKGIVSGLFYDDFIVDDRIGGDNHLGPYPNEKQSCKWLIYPWQGSGYLNNDMNRPADKGTSSAKLKKKVISNLRYSTTILDDYNDNTTQSFDITPQIFNSDEVSIVKFADSNSGYLYKGNIDTMLTPDAPDGSYFCFNGWVTQDIQTPFTSTTWCKTFNKQPSTQEQNGIRKWNNSNEWVWGEAGVPGDDIGDDYIDLVLHKNPVRMKYKSTPHLFGHFNLNLGEANMQLAVTEIWQDVAEGTRFGGTSDDAMKENVWIPCGEPVTIANNAELYWDYGDTYYQRYDCLKTYPFTREDINQIVEIGSFMLETHVNIDGRYDRNRGQANNLNMSPQNFNLINPVYSQVDNFFSYKIMDEDDYQNTRFLNQITWSKTKEAGADVDLWTNVTLASILELDGDKGTLNKLIRFNNFLFAFQDTGISQILYNDNVQIQSTQGVPIEIANSGKVSGKDYKSSSIGCSNKWSMVTTPLGIYFMDSNDKSIYLFNGQLANISSNGGFNSWCKQHIPTSDIRWTPEDFDNFVGYYDKLNQDVLFINKDIALAWSEKIQAFTSFYNYGHIPFFCTLSDKEIWITSPTRDNPAILWEHQGGDYCKFFGENKPYWMTLVGNPEPQTDKIFTNLEFRACVEGEGTTKGFSLFDETFDYTFGASGNGHIPYLPFDNLETWDEYQHGNTPLEIKNGHSAFIHGGDTSSVMRKFRIWRCDVPRDNAELAQDEKARGIFRVKRRPLDRMRNTWLYLKLLKNAADIDDALPKAEIHDLVMTYYN